MKRLKIKQCCYCVKGVMNLKLMDTEFSGKCTFCNGTGIITQEDRLNKHKQLTTTNRGSNMAKSIENNPFFKKLQKVWKDKDDNYVISYMSAANKVKYNDDIAFLIDLKRTVKSL